jgi:hypothetical protein
MLTKITLAAAALTIGLATPSIAAPYNNGPFGGGFHNAKPAQWELVGQRTVSFRPEREQIQVYGRDRHKQIMVCVYNQPVRIADLSVSFKNGGKQDVAVRNVIGAGQCTRAIDLNGHKRDIKSVNLKMQKAGFFPASFGRPALVKVFAR